MALFQTPLPPEEIAQFLQYPLPDAVQVNQLSVAAFGFGQSTGNFINSSEGYNPI